MDAGSLHDDLLRGIHEAGMYEFATDVGILQNGELPEVRMHESAWAGETDAPPPPEPPAVEDADVVAQGRALADAAAQAAAEAAAAAACARSRAAAAAAASAAAGFGGGADGAPAAPAGGRKRGPASLDAADSAGPPPPHAGSGAAANNGKGLRHFSLKVCAAVEAAGATTYNEVADALVADLASAGLVGSGPGALDEKNIRRRVYDALNVLMALGTITKVKKAIRWVGLPLPDGNGSTAGLVGGAGGGLRRPGGHAASPALARLRSERDRLRAAVERGAATVGELERQASAFRALVSAHAAAPASALRARAAAGDAAAPTPLALPFILIHVRPDAPVEVQIAADTRAAAFDFGGAPFRITGAEEVLYAMGLHDQQRPAAGAAAAADAAAAAAAHAAPVAATPARAPRPASTKATPAGAAPLADDDAMAASPAPVSSGRATRTSRRSAAAAAAAAAAATTAMDASPYLARGHRGRQQSPAPPACGASSGGPGLAASPRAGAWPVA